jgi:hypothetical protein
MPLGGFWGDVSPEIGGRWVLAIAGPALDGSRPGWAQPRPTYGIAVAMTVSVSTLASGGRSAM